MGLLFSQGKVVYEEKLRGLWYMRSIATLEMGKAISWHPEILGEGTIGGDWDSILLCLFGRFITELASNLFLVPPLNMAFTSSQARRTTQLHMTPPRIEVRCIRLDVLVVGTESVRVEDELVRGEEQTTHGAFDAFSSRGVVARGQERTLASPGAFVEHCKSKVLRQTWSPEKGNPTHPWPGLNLPPPAAFSSACVLVTSHSSTDNQTDSDPPS
nr:unnamed protein product [Callosobruchus chinensis]